MELPGQPLKNSGPTLVNQEKPLSPESRPRKTNSKSKPAIQTDLLNTGLENLNPKKKLARGSENSSKGKLPVPKPLPKPRDRTQDALKRLGVEPAALRSAPEITPILKLAQGGLKAVLGALRLYADDPSISSFLEVYDETPVGDREKLPWEAIALAADVDLRSFLGSAILAVQSQAANMTRMIAVSSQPKITQARVKYGLLPSGEKDRTALDMTNGVLPSPKGPTFIGKAIFGSGNQTMSAQGAGKGDDDEDGPVIEGDDEPDLDKLFPPSNDIQQKLIPIRQRMLDNGN